MDVDAKPNPGAVMEGISGKIGPLIDGLMRHETLVVALALLLIVAVNVFLRVGLLGNQGLFEPDGFYYYSVIRETINNGLAVPATPVLSGFPWRNARGENAGLPLLTAVAYTLVGGFGVSYLTVMRLMPVLFGVLYALGAYWLAKELTGSRYVGVLGALFLSMSSGSIARTAALIYRGDSFASLALLGALVLTIEALHGKDKKKAALYAIGAGVVLSTGIIVWSGAPFEVLVYLLAILLLAVYGFVYKLRGVIERGLMLSGGLIVAYALEHVYELFGIVKSGFYLSGTDFFMFYVPVVAVGALALYLTDNPKFAFFADRRNRLVAVFLCVALVAVVLFGAFGRHIDRLLAFNGVVATGNQTYDQIGQALAGTTQEQQAVSWNFLFASFNLQLPLAVIGVLFFPFIYAWGERRRDSSAPRLKFTDAFIVLFAYFAVTLFLQMGAIRFNALLSTPLAIFAACGAYIEYEASKDLFMERGTRRGLAVILLVAVIGVYLLDKLAYVFVPSISGLGSNVLLLSSMLLVIAFIVAAIAYSLYGIAVSSSRKTSLKYLSLLLIFVLLVYNFYSTYLTAYSANPADGIGADFLNAMVWLRGNTAKNATVLALWPDGSVVEGWANRTSYMDSVGGENRTRIYFFSKFLFNTTNDTQYLYHIGKPDYLVTRGFWYKEMGGIATEGLIPNMSRFGYSTLSSLDISHNNGTDVYLFKSNQPPYYASKLLVHQNVNGSTAFEAFIGTSTGITMLPMRTVLFYNEQNMSYAIATSNASDATDYTLLISYAQNKIVGGAILGPELMNTNLFKLTILCNSFECPYGNNNIKMTMVYGNNDTRIYRINYLN